MVIVCVLYLFLSFQPICVCESEVSLVGSIQLALLFLSSPTICLLNGVFNPFLFNVIFEMVGFVSPIWSVFHIPHMSFFSSVPLLLPFVFSFHHLKFFDFKKLCFSQYLSWGLRYASEFITVCFRFNAKNTPVQLHFLISPSCCYCRIYYVCLHNKPGDTVF